MPAQNQDSSVWLREDGAGVRNWSAVALSSEGRVIAATVSGGYVYTSENGGLTWTERTSSGSRSWTDIVMSSDGTKLAAIVSGGYVYTSSDSGVSWSARTGAGTASWVGIGMSADGTRIAVADATRVLISSDSGASWNERLTMPPAGGGYYGYDEYGNLVYYGTPSETVTSIAVSSNGLKVAAGTSQGNVRISSDGGASWPTTGYTYTYTSITDISASSDGSALVAVIPYNYAYKSNDGGVSWAGQYSLSTANWSDVAISQDGYTMLVSVTNGSVGVARGSGTSGGEAGPLSGGGANSGSTLTGAWYTYPGTQTWTSIASSADGQRAVAVGQNGYIWTKDTDRNNNPTNPSLGGPASGVINTTYTFNMTATDPDDNTIRYAIDWNNDGTIDEYAPASGYVASGTQGQKDHSWPSAGTYTWKARTEDQNGATSIWVSYITTITDPIPIVLLTTSSDTYIDGGNPITLSWSSSYAVSCTGANFSTGGATSGSVVIAPTQATTYTLTCTDAGGTTSAEASRTIGYICNAVYSCTTYTTRHSSCPSSAGGTDTSCDSGTTCSGGVCGIWSDASAESFTVNGVNHSGHLHGYPSFVRPGDRTFLFWRIVSVYEDTCTIRGNTPEDTWSGPPTGTTTFFSGESGVQTGVIQQATTYTLTCRGLSGTQFTERATIHTTPTWMER